jgi:phage terminase large subunit-like protein
MDREKIIEAIRLLEEQKRRRDHRKILTYFPETGPFRRELYVKHQEFFAAGKDYRERLMLAANRVGKTEGVGGYELTVHLTGQYPEWWPGRRFNRAIKSWAAGDTGKTVREILQEKLLGPPGAWGTGLIPGETIAKITTAHNAETVDTIFVKHVSGGLSRVTFKSYEGGRKTFQGTEQDIIWYDEEPPLAVYTEGLLRTMTNNGMVMLTFTPLLGLSEVVLVFLPGGRLHAAADGTHALAGSKFVVMATWDDAPHLTKAAKEELWKSIPPFQRDARSKGVPQLGAGAIYPVPESEIIVKPFPVPDHYARGYGMDVGWNCTAAIHGALDRDTDTLYLYHGYKKGQAEPSVHVHGIRAPGEWIPGFIDPAARGRNQKDGTQLMQDYMDLGLLLETANNAVEAGIYRIWQRMASGRLKIFESLGGWLEEYRLYRRDEKGQIVKSNDHYMDGTRYLESRIDAMIVKPVKKAEEETGRVYDFGTAGQSWMG